MSKMSDYQSGREDGLLLAAKLVKEGGLERLEEEIKYRGITGIHTQLAKKRTGESYGADQNEYIRHCAAFSSPFHPGRIRIWSGTAPATD